MVDCSKCYSLRWCGYIIYFCIIFFSGNIVYGLRKYDRKDLRNLRYSVYTVVVSLKFECLVLFRGNLDCVCIYIHLQYQWMMQ
jgi:hypothetical protein